MSTEFKATAIRSTNQELLAFGEIFHFPKKEAINSGINYDFRLAVRWFTWKRTAIIVTLLWIFTSLFFIPNLTGAWGQTGFEKPTFSCTVLYDKDAGVNPLRVIFGIGIILAVLIIGVSYFLLIKVRLFLQLKLHTDD